MFYIWNIKGWLDEVFRTVSLNRLNPEESIFGLVIFSSLDDQYVRYFKQRREQISSYSGANVHIFTPTIGKDNIVSDNEIRILIGDLNELGLEVTNRPAIVMFKLGKAKNSTGYEPEFFGVYHLPDFRRFKIILRDFIDLCYRNRSNVIDLDYSLRQVFHSNNHINMEMVRNIPRARKENHTLRNLKDNFAKPVVFISYNSGDREYAAAIVDGLDQTKITPWIDFKEITAGENIRSSVDAALERADMVLAILSSNSMKADWIRYETAWFSARGMNNRLIPVVIDEDGREMAKSMPNLQGILYLDVSSDRQDGINKISALIERKLAQID